MNINLDLGITTKIDAINQVLESVGSVGINSEEEIDYNIDASSADKLIDSVSQKIQDNSGRGWWFNREEFHKLTPNPVTGIVTVPSNTTSCKIKRNDRNQPLPVTLRGTRLFDTKNVGYDMRELVDSSGLLPCVLVVNLEFDFIPTTAKHAITDACRFWFVNDKEGDQIKMASHQRAANSSYISLQSEDAGQQRRNLLNNGRISSAINKIGGYNNN